MEKNSYVTKKLLNCITKTYRDKRAEITACNYAIKDKGNNLILEMNEMAENWKKCVNQLLCVREKKKFCKNYQSMKTKKKMNEHH